MIVVALMNIAMAGCDEGLDSLGQVLTHADATGVDYSALSLDDSALEAYASAIRDVKVDACTDPEKKAFWINAYNGLTIKVVVDNWPIQSMKDLDGGNPWDRRKFTVAGETLTLNQIEHEKLRPMGDPRIHAALNCASIGCPPLKTTPFQAEGLGQALTEHARTWVAHNAVVVGDTRVGFSKVFEWFAQDFPRPDREVPGVDGKFRKAAVWTARFAPPPVAAILLAGGYEAYWVDYDWGLNTR